MAAMAGAVMQSLELPVAFRLAGRAQERQSGLVQRIGVPQFLRPIVAVVLLDYTLYLWHVLTHRVPLLWRFHQVHHIDREMDASTALRFHFGEITLSVAFRAAQVLAIGATPATLAAWQMFLFVCILFHHSNVRLPIAWERRVARIVMTPRLHGIHHSIAPADVNSNWSSGLTVWDWLHGTLRTDVPQHSIVIGVAGHLNYGNQELKKVLTVPFTESSRPIPRSGGRVRQPISALED
jgi:sterol desaturase/sphingolipid hydroxylase (fatty acid hydroxylase superfamily)